jgi:S-adenosylmethionine decarboxylase proenzyme
MGKHFLLNLYGCSSVLLNDERFLIDLIENAAIASGATVLKTVSHKFDPQGITAICLLSESHISIHTYPELGKCYADIYTCGSADPKIGCDIIISQFNPTEYKLTYVQR